MLLATVVLEYGIDPATVTVTLFPELAAVTPVPTKSRLASAVVMFEPSSLTVMVLPATPSLITVSTILPV